MTLFCLLDARWPDTPLGQYRINRTFGILSEWVRQLPAIQARNHDLMFGVEQK